MSLIVSTCYTWFVSHLAIAILGREISSGMAILLAGILLLALICLMLFIASLKSRPRKAKSTKNDSPFDDEDDSFSSSVRPSESPFDDEDDIFSSPPRRSKPLLGIISFILFIILAGVGIFLFVQSPSIFSDHETPIKGIVRNARTNEALKDVEIVIGDEEHKAKTTSTGKFQLPSISIPESSVLVIARKDGFFEWSDIIERETLFSQELEILLAPKIRIVFTDFTLQDQNSSLKTYEAQIPQAMQNAFVDCYELTVLTRKDLITILGEEEFEDTFKHGIFDPKELAKRNKKIGANYIITGTFSQTDAGIQIQAKMHNMEEGTIELIKAISVTKQELLLAAARFLSLHMIAAKFAKVAITNIEYSAIVSRQIEVHGTTSCLPEGWVIWVSVQPSGVDRHYPQGYATVTANSWVVTTVYLGAEDKTEDQYRPFHVYAILADPDAHEIFSEYKKEQMYDGFLELPDGTKISDSRVVTRQNQ